jgi:hypothetical protein
LVWTASKENKRFSSELQATSDNNQTDWFGQQEGKKKGFQGFKHPVTTIKQIGLDSK